MRKWTRIKLYIGKHEKPTDENIMRLLMPSILGVLVCMVCLFGSTWAWFTAGIQVDGDAATKAANFSADVTVREIPGATVQTIAAIQAGETGRALAVQSNENTENASGESVDEALNEKNWIEVDVEDADGMDFQLKANTAYAVRIRATGSTTIGGYVVISDESREYYTVDMQSAEAKDGNGAMVRIAGAEETIEFFVIPGETAVYHFTPVWGEYEGSREDGTALLSNSTDAGAYADVDTLKDKEGDSVAAAVSDAGIVWFSNRIRIGDGSVIGDGSLPVADESVVTGDTATEDGASGTDGKDSTTAENGSASGGDQAQNSGSDATGAGSDSDSDSGKNGTGSDKTGSSHDGAASSSGSDGNGAGSTSNSTTGSESISAGTDEGHGSGSGAAESGGNHGNTSTETESSGADAGTGAE